MILESKNEKNPGWHLTQAKTVGIGSGGGTLTSNDNDTTVTVTAGVVGDGTVFDFKPQPYPNYWQGGGMGFGNKSFQLTVEDSGGNPITNFDPAINIKIHYGQLWNRIDEESLLLYYWNSDSGSWEDAACSGYTRNLEENWFSVDVCHLSEFAVWGELIYINYLPLIIR